jgi:R3H domain/SUZ-C motif
VSLNIPTPYAFNYHLDPAGSFRGLAFANFRLPQDADAVVAALNGFDVQGRKLRVEYKKVLQAGEKERIEREKAIRRMRSMQLEKEQQAQQQQQGYDEFGPVVTPGMTPSRSFSAGMGMVNPYQQAYNPPMPPIPPQQTYMNASPPHASPAPAPQQPAATPAKSSTELDLNDPSTLDIYSRILLFKDDHMRDELAFSRTLSPKQRRVVHLVAQKLGVYHYSVGEGDERYAVVTRVDPQGRVRVFCMHSSTSIILTGLMFQPAAQRAVSQTLSRAPSSYLSPTSPMDSPSNNLRSKKSMPDMKTLHTSAPRLTTRSSNGNIREGYHTIASPSRRSPGGFGALFGSGGGFGSLGGSSAVPPVPSLPAGVNGGSAGGGGGASDGPNSGVVRQPRGPSGASGFSTRRERATASEATPPRGLEARTHEPLEI